MSNGTQQHPTAGDKQVYAGRTYTEYRRADGSTYRVHDNVRSRAASEEQTYVNKAVALKRRNSYAGVL